GRGATDAAARSGRGTPAVAGHSGKRRPSSSLAWLMTEIAPESWSEALPALRGNAPLGNAQLGRGFQGNICPGPSLLKVGHSGFACGGHAAATKRGFFMRIAQVAPLTEAIPPQRYGGTERVVHWLVEELVGLGHDVTLFASGDSQTSAQLAAMWPRALRHDAAVRDPNALHMSMLERVRQQAADFDFLHFHLDYYPFSLFSRQSTAFTTTWHGRLDLSEHQTVFATFPDVPVVSISDAQRRPVPHARWV